MAQFNLPDRVYAHDFKVYGYQRMYRSLSAARGAASTLRYNLNGGNIFYADANWQVLDQIVPGRAAPWQDTELRRAARMRERAAQLIKQAEALEESRRPKFDSNNLMW